MHVYCLHLSLLFMYGYLWLKFKLCQVAFNATYLMQSCILDSYFNWLCIGYSGALEVQFRSAILGTSGYRIITKSLFHCSTRLAETNQLPFGFVIQLCRNKWSRCEMMTVFNKIIDFHF